MLSDRGKIAIDLAAFIFVAAVGAWFIAQGKWILAIMFILPGCARTAWSAARIYRRMRRGQSTFSPIPQDGWKENN